MVHLGMQMKLSHVVMELIISSSCHQPAPIRRE